MTDSDFVHVNDLKSFVELVAQSRVGVEWQVFCDIGPEWIGAGRSIQFFVDGRPLTDNQLHGELKQALVRALNIPEKSVDSVICGEGQLIREEGRLVVEFEWHDAVPYMDSHDSGIGTAVLSSSLNSLGLSDVSKQ